jgi:hypothetical protein
MILTSSTCLNPMNFLHTILHLGLAATLTAQIPQSMVFTAGTTARDGGGQDHAFILWEAPGADLLGGKTFAIYGKAGAADAAVDYTQEGIISGSLQPAVITACLTQAAALGQNLDDFDSVLASIHYGCFYPDPVPALNGDRVAKTITVLTKARTLPNLVGKLRTLVMLNPTMALCLGMAWSAPMPASTKTYELREWNTATSADGPVIGRVTLTGGSPVILPAASRPVQVPDATPSGDLKVRLRWGVPDTLKRRIMLHQGFRLWRLPWALVQSQGYQIAAPDLNQLMGHATAGQAVLVTKKPLYLTKALSPAQAEDLSAPLADQTIYLDDDLGRLSDPANYTPPTDGAEYGYIVTPRDLLGRDGMPSQAGRGQILRTLPPPVPREPRVDLVFGARNAQGVRPQHFHFSFLANENDTENPTTAYEVYRGTGQMVDGQGLPLPENLITPIIHPALPGRVAHDDMPPYPFTASQQVWFCVRAVRTTPAGTFFSPLSPPVYAALANVEPPQAPSPVSLGNLCPQPGIQLAGQSAAALDPAPDDGLNHFRMICDRLDSQVVKAAFSFKRQGQATEEPLDQIEFSDDRVQVDFTLPDAAVLEDTTFICRVWDGESSLPPAEYFAVRPAAALAPDAVHEVHFLAAVLSPTSLDSEHLVSPYFLNTPLAEVVESLTIAPGRSPAITAHVENLPARDGFQVQRLFGAVWRPVGFGQSAPGSVEDVVFMDSTDTGPTTTAAHYRLIPIVNLRACASNDFTYHAVTSRDGRANPVRICMFYHSTPENEVLEYRFYRRVNDGPLSLFAEGRVKAGTTPNPICVMDPAPPALGGTVLYYGQTVAANGVGSGLSYTGGRGAVPAELPRPVLAAPQGSGNDEDPKVTLTWTCPAESVLRFEVSLVPKGGEPVTASVPSITLGSTPRMSRRKPPSNAAALANAVLFVPAVNVQLLATDRVGSTGIGSGPVFTQTYPILANQDYDISVRAIGHDKTAGPDSAVYTFRWQLPKPLNDPDIPWPFRALPSVSSTQGEVANMTFDDAFAPPHLPDPLIWPVVTGGQVGFAIGSIPLGQTGNEVDFRISEDVPGVKFSGDSNIRNSTSDFNERLYPRHSGTQDSILPAVLYRQQLPNAEWPEVSGDVVQVSPMISKLLWTDEPSIESNASFLRDPFIGVRYITGPLVNNALPYPASARLYLLDTTPRAVGARYRYWLVCFSTNTGGPEYIIPATLEEVTP